MIVVVFFFMFLAFPRPQNILGTIFRERLQLTLLWSSYTTIRTVLKSFSIPQSPASMLIHTTRSTPDTTKGPWYYHALYNSIVNSRRPRVSTSVWEVNSAKRKQICCVRRRRCLLGGGGLTSRVAASVSLAATYPGGWRCGWLRRLSLE